MSMSQFSRSPRCQKQKRVSRRYPEVTRQVSLPLPSGPCASLSRAGYSCDAFSLRSYVSYSLNAFPLSVTVHCMNDRIRISGRSICIFFLPAGFRNSHKIASNVPVFPFLFSRVQRDCAQLRMPVLDSFCTKIKIFRLECKRNRDEANREKEKPVVMPPAYPRV